MAFLQLIFPLSSQYLQGTCSATSSTENLTVQEVAEQLAARDCDKIVIQGPDRADKTSLVFQAAVSAAASGAKVSYICTHPLKRLPMQVHGMMSPEPNIMRNVDFLYLEEASELIGWCAGVHTKAKLPSLIIIEDILAYATQINDRNLEQSLARLCATISDATSWIASNNDVKKCSVLMTAPARITSLDSILSQFEFKAATYKGPGADEPNSQLLFETEEFYISVKFSHLKDTIVIADVQAAKTF